MLKKGAYRAFRNLPVGWVLQAIHSTDSSERNFRFIVELSLLLICTNIIIQIKLFDSVFTTILFSFFITHTINWFITGNFWVYILDSFIIMKNQGVNSIISYIKLTKRILLLGNFCDSILIYGSMCRSQLHIRSDLDLRIVRRTDSKKGYLCLPLAFFLRAYSFFIMMPVDLQVVDSAEFLGKQMRSDEKPIVVYCRNGVVIKNAGKSFLDIERKPETVLKDKQ